MSQFTDFLAKQGLGSITGEGDAAKFALNQETKDKLKEAGKNLFQKGKAAGTAAGIAQAKYKGDQALIDKQKELSQSNLQKYGGMAKNLENQIMGGKFDSAAMAKAASDQMSVAETGRQAAMEQAAKSGGDVVSALRSGDPRAMATGAGLIEGTQAAVNQANLAAAQDKAAAGQQYAGYDAAQKGKQQQFATNMFDTAKGLELGAEQDIQQAKMDETQLKANRMLDAATNYQAFSQLGKSQEKPEEPDNSLPGDSAANNTVNNTVNSTPAAPDTGGQGRIKDFLSGLSDTKVNPLQPPKTIGSFDVQNIGEQLGKSKVVGSLLQRLGNMPIGAEGLYMGEEGFVTEGEFNHDTNKKAVVDEESGEKEAELTGGEFVFNPKQTNRIESLVEKDNAEGLLKFMRNLLKKPQFKK